MGHVSGLYAQVAGPLRPQDRYSSWSRRYSLTPSIVMHARTLLRSSRHMTSRLSRGAPIGARAEHEGSEVSIHGGARCHCTPLAAVLSSPCAAHRPHAGVRRERAALIPFGRGSSPRAWRARRARRSVSRHGPIIVHAETWGCPPHRLSGTISAEPPPCPPAWPAWRCSRPYRLRYTARARQSWLLPSWRQ